MVMGMVLDGMIIMIILLTIKKEKKKEELVYSYRVRAAGPLTPVGQSLCHPFRCGKFIFMHNGVIGGFERVQRTLLGLVHGIAFDIAMAHSAIDSAVAFAIFLTELCPNPVSINESYEKMNYDANAIRKAMEKTVLKIRHECEIAYKDTPLSLPSSLANFLVSDGHTIIATRYAWGRQGEVVASCSLYYITGSKWAYFPTSNNTPRNSGIRKSMVDNYHMVHTDPRAKVAIVSSEPLNTIHDEWTPVPHNHTLVYTRGKEGYMNTNNNKKKKEKSMGGPLWS
ncbi:conserved hypothetical protein [Perkinsus marinus ATCC 50983]|uniref:Glutamine amidotransferase type-2 domain-containing protein n=1 Tax=Perkinsus marinus (strain ATCC 50983 / TXsc) TaxID=423536 RepID=C5LLW9_PERM5|nr:conserved hypothetical protein [Perkinsus marinus ATCC 50983]EER02341.1 conserved hypothetical protein [Perkinsus marinus ATCC 50983]|eukprot:XP_002769623.1 conserved hypothetical protein [Perkinsus marinus ATCC 50983]